MRHTQERGFSLLVTLLWFTQLQVCSFSAAGSKALFVPCPSCEEVLRAPCCCEPLKALAFLEGFPNPSPTCIKTPVNNLLQNPRGHTGYQKLSPQPRLRPLAQAQFTPTRRPEKKQKPRNKTHVQQSQPQGSSQPVFTS